MWDVSVKMDALYKGCRSYTMVLLPRMHTFWWQAQHSTPAVRPSLMEAQLPGLWSSQVGRLRTSPPSWGERRVEGKWKAWQHTWVIVLHWVQLGREGDSSRTVGVRLRLGVPLHSYCVVLLVVYGSTTTREQWANPNTTSCFQRGECWSNSVVAGVPRKMIVAIGDTFQRNQGWAIVIDWYIKQGLQILPSIRKSSIGYTHSFKTFALPPT